MKKEWGEHIFETTPYDVVNGKACVFVEDRGITDVAEESYIAGATEQKDIDIERAWSLAYSMYQIGRDNLSPLTKDEFIKAMEE